MSKYPSSELGDKTSPIASRVVIGRTATGVLYRTQKTVAMVPERSMFLLLQELAARIKDPEATVTSSLASRVEGELAYKAWLSTSITAGFWISEAGPTSRIASLYNIVGLIRTSGRAEGLESVLATAINGCWPWLSPKTLSHILTLAEQYVKKSELAETHGVPVIDSITRHVGLFTPGELNNLNIPEWMAEFDIAQDEYISGRPGVGPKGNPLGNRGPGEMLGERGSDMPGGMPGGWGTDPDEMADWLRGDDPGGVPGGLPNKADLPGGKSTGNTGRPSVDAMAKEFLGKARPGQGQGGVPGGLPSINDVPGRQPSAGEKRQASIDERAEQLIVSMGAGGSQKGASGFIAQSNDPASGFKSGAFKGATPGGPFAPTGQLGINGEGGEGWKESAVYIASGVGLAAAAVLGVAAAPAIAVTVVTMGAALAVGAASGTLIGVGVVEAMDTASDSKKDRPDPPKDKPREGDLYPDPNGGGGGNPTQMWDENGGGGTPNTIWDENGGGGTPNTIEAGYAKVQVVDGPGVMVDFVQLNGALLHY